MVLEEKYNPGYTVVKKALEFLFTNHVIDEEAKANYMNIFAKAKETISPTYFMVDVIKEIKQDNEDIFIAFPGRMHDRLALSAVNAAAVKNDKAGQIGKFDAVDPFNIYIGWSELVADTKAEREAAKEPCYAEAKAYEAENAETLALYERLDEIVNTYNKLKGLEDTARDRVDSICRQLDSLNALKPSADIVLR